MGWGEWFRVSSLGEQGVGGVKSEFMYRTYEVSRDMPKRRTPI